MAISLFDPVKMAHNFDPHTSHEAAQEQVRSGKAARHAELVLRLVKEHPFLTAVELFWAATPAERSDLKEHQRVRQRLVDLHRANLVKYGPTKVCSVNQTRMKTWESI